MKRIRRTLVRGGWLGLILSLGAGALLAGAAETAPRRVSFTELAGFSFPSTVTVRSAPPIPAAIQELHGQFVAVSGYMLPTRLQGSRVSQFLLMRSVNTCCFGIPLNLNEVILVDSPPGGVKSLMDVPVTFVGQLEVQPMVEGEEIVGLYRLRITDGRGVPKSLQP